MNILIQSIVSIALALLAAASGPGVPESTKTQAIQVASSALAFAQANYVPPSDPKNAIDIPEIPQGTGGAVTVEDVKGPIVKWTPSNAAKVYPGQSGTVFRVLTDEPLDISETKIFFCQLEDGDCQPHYSGGSAQYNYVYGQPVSIVSLASNISQDGGYRNDFAVAPFTYPHGQVATNGTMWVFYDGNGNASERTFSDLSFVGE